MDPCGIRTPLMPLIASMLLAVRLSWLAVRDDFRNWLQLGLRPAKENENPGLDRMSAGSGEIEISHGAIEAEQLFDPERV
jgi:hypothetical protein